MHSLRNLVRRWIVPVADPRALLSLALLPRFLLELRRYRRLAHQEVVTWSDAYPCLSDRIRETPFDPHYFYQGAWLARRLRDAPAAFHVDVGSSVMMVNVISATMKTMFLDFRPLRVTVPHLHPVAGNLTRLPFADASVPSLSCLHVIEHVGLGRYGDPLDPQGGRLAAENLERIVRPGGRLFLSTPIGRERVCFNAHRVYAPKTVTALFPTLRLESFALVDDCGRFRERADLHMADGLDYGCGMFEFMKAK
jgi:hypothetical protein